MMFFIIAWLMIGFAHWLDYMFRFCYAPNILDFILGLPTFLIAGPITTINKML